MTGFIRGLFGSKPKLVEAGDQPEQSVKQPQTQEKAFFLESDEAISLGNVDYMRSVKVVKRTFPKTVSSPDEMELVQKVSAMEKMNGNGQAPIGETVTPVTPAAETKASSNGAASERPLDSSMDLFRNMARDIKKR